MTHALRLGALLLGVSFAVAPSAPARPLGDASLPADAVVRAGERGAPRYLSGELSAPRARGVSAEAHAFRFVGRHAALFGLTDPAAQLQLVDITRDKAGGEHVIYRQLQDGVPVFRSLLAVHMDKDGVVRTVNARILPGLRSSSMGALPEVEARRIMGIELGSTLIEATPGELFVLATSADSDVLAWRIPTFLADPQRGQTPVALWVDAKTGSPLFGDDPIMRGDALVTGPGVLGETLTVHGFEGRNFRLEVSPMLRLYVQQAPKGAYNLVDQSTRDLGWIYTFDANETFLLDNEYVHSATSNFSSAVDPGQAAGLSAHYNARRTLDFYDQRFGRRGLDDKGLSVASLVQIDDPVPSYPLEINAGWLGFGFNFMIYGAGGEWPPESGVIWSSFSGALDVIGHELSHGVDEFTINLGYEHESGALNEHLADVMGVATQAHWEGLDWLVGEGLFEQPAYPYDAVRSFEDPTLYQQPDRMSTFAAYPLSYDAGGVHFNSGIGNKAFYLAVEGGRFNGVTVQPLAADVSRSLVMAGDIWYDVMESRRIDPNSQLIDMRTATIDAARSLYPAAVPTLVAAWDAVEVTEDQYPDPTVDVTEPNDYKTISVPVTVGDQVQGYLWNRADCDMYALTGDGNVEIRLSNLATPARIAVYKPFIYGQLTEEGSSNNEGIDDELIQLKLKSGTTYYIEVMVEGPGVGSATQPYTLEVSRG